METSQAHAKHIRIPPRKARLAADIIRGLQVENAVTQLKYCNLKAGRILIKTLSSAIANAEMNWDARRDQLYVVGVWVDEGPRLKRSKSKSRGGRAPIIKRTSHFTVVVGEKAAKEQ